MPHQRSPDAARNAIDIPIPIYNGKRFIAWNRGLRSISTQVSHAPDLAPRAISQAGSNAWKYSSGWKNVRTHKALNSRNIKKKARMSLDCAMTACGRLGLSRVVLVLESPSEEGPSVGDTMVVLEKDFFFHLTFASPGHSHHPPQSTGIYACVYLGGSWIDWLAGSSRGLPGVKPANLIDSSQPYRYSSSQSRSLDKSPLLSQACTSIRKAPLDRCRL
jgi:hypothetical protein